MLNNVTDAIMNGQKSKMNKPIVELTRPVGFKAVHK